MGRRERERSKRGPGGGQSSRPKGPKRPEGGKRSPKRGPERPAKRGPQRSGERGAEAQHRGPMRRPPLRGKPAAPKRKPRPRRVFPEVKVGPPGLPRRGDYLLTTRPGAEQDLIEELYFLDEKTEPRLGGESLVVARALPKRHGQVLELAFARQGFPVGTVVAADGEAVARAARGLIEDASRKPVKWALDVWVPDADEMNKLSGTALGIEAQAHAAVPSLSPQWAPYRTPDPRAAFADNGLYVQACILPDRTCAVGVAWARDALSLAPGGRLRVHVSDAAPSRAAMKLEEALAWLDRAPEPNDLCVDLGAAPGGWTWVMLQRRCNVIAVDPGNLDKGLDGKKGLIHAKGDAFRFEPPEAVDWLLCDMAWRPLEVAALLAKWARNEWARQLIANIKLPMRKKAEHLLRVRDILEDGGWNHVKMRQLYHDREEVTVAAVRV